MIEVRRLSDVAGAEVTGLDTRSPIGAADVERLQRAFAEHLVLVFRGEKMSPQEFCAFSRQFGELQPHVAKRYRHPEVPEIVMMTNRDEKGRYDEVGASRGLGWHSDTCYNQAPAKATVLHALELPDRGGNTAFCNMYMAYDRMPPALRRRVEGRLAFFRYGGRYRKSVAAISAADQEVPNVVHPVIRTHPETGRKSVYVNPYHTLQICGMSREESDGLLDELFAWCDRDEFVWEHEWTPGATIIWENRSAWHTARDDYPKDQARIFFRTTLAGTRTVDEDTVRRCLSGAAH